tara:strand:- start:442 stop:639 length:198 start_codon:yes stop_codon:yes gene_type:complete
MIDKLIPARLRSRKLWISVATSCLVVLVVAVFDISEEQANTIVTGVVGTAAAYLIGQGVADHGKG